MKKISLIEAKSFLEKEFPGIELVEEIFGFNDSAYRVLNTQRSQRNYELFITGGVECVSVHGQAKYGDYCGYGRLCFTLEELRKAIQYGLKQSGTIIVPKKEHDMSN